MASRCGTSLVLAGLLAFAVGACKKDAPKPTPDPSIVRFQVMLVDESGIGGSMPSEVQPIVDTSEHCPKDGACVRQEHRSLRIEPRRGETRDKLLARARTYLAHAEPPPGDRVAYSFFYDDRTTPAELLHVSALALGKMILDQADVAVAEATKGNATLGVPGFPQDEALRLILTPEGTRRFAEATAAAEGRRIAFAFGDEVLYAPVVHGRMSDGKILVSLGWGAEAKAAAEALAHRLAKPPPTK